MRWERKYLSASEIAGFDRYRYSSIDSSWISKYVMSHFWNWCLKLLPTWVAPNLLTFTGFLLNVFNFLLIAYYDYNFTAASHSVENYPIPRWVYLVMGINFFVAYTLDAIDGLQARRTGTSTPLGELFDHGLDIYSSVFIMSYMFSLFGRQNFSVMWMQLVSFVIYLNFYVSFFEKYHTRIMFIPVSYNMVMWGCTLVLLGASIFGPKIYIRNSKTPRIPTSTYRKLLYVSAVFANYPKVAWNIYQSYKNKTGHMRSAYEGAKPLFPLIALFAFSTSWAYFSPNKILEYDPRVFFLITGTVFTNFSCRLIVAEMTDTIFNGWNHQLTLYAISSLICTAPYQALGLPAIPFIFENSLLIGLLIIFTVLHIRYASGVVNEMCKHFGIKCFTIKPKKQC